MIGKIIGIVDQISDDNAIILVNNIGFVVFCAKNVLLELQNAKNNQLQISLITETIVKEGAIELYGFLNSLEKTWFLELNKVQSVGAKVALKILSAFSVNEIAQALIVENSKLFLQVSGIGPKLANRIIMELKNSPKKIGFNLEQISDNSANLSHNQVNNLNDALLALESLGYKKFEATKIVNLLISQNPEITLENLITSSLRELSKI